MRKRTLTLLGAIACAASIVKLYAVSEPVASVASGASLYHDKVQPILQKECYGCHATSAMSGLRVDSVAAMLKGGSSGPSVTPGDPDKSLLIIAVRRTDPNLQMPQGGPKLS